VSNFSLDAHEQLLKNLDGYFRETLNIQEGNKELRVVDVELPVAERTDDFKAQKKAKLQGLSYARPVHVRLELRADGRVVDRRKIKVLDVPQVTVRGTYVVGGNEYSFPLQKRLIPGVYTKKHEDGTISSWFNSAKGRNVSVRLREKGDFVLEVETSTINLLAALVGLGVPADKIRRAWGPEVYAANVKATGSKNPELALKKLYTKLRHPSDPEAATADIPGYRAWILSYFENKSEFDQDNVELTMKVKAGKISPGLLLMSTQRILGISRQEQDEDNRESLVHNNIFDVSDFAIERLENRLYRGKIQRTLRRNMKRSDKVAEIVQKALFQGPLESTFTQTSLSKIPKQNNPMDQHSAYTEISSRGEGGIMSFHAITRDTRAVDPTHLNFIDPMHTPEGESIGTSLHVATGVRKVGKDLMKTVWDVKKKKLVEISPREFYRSAVAFAEYVNPETGRIKPKDGRVKVSVQGKIKEVDPVQVKYAIRRTTDMFGVNSIAVPFLSHNNGTRGMTASRMQTQSKSLKYREKPLVQAAVHEASNKTVEEMVGRASLPKSPVKGVVAKVKRDEVVIVDAGGKEHVVGIPKNFWLNSNNFHHVDLTVQAGDQVKKGQVLGESNYTVDGELALGTNLKTAYITYKGYNHEDGVVISETCAEKLTSMHALQKSFQVSGDDPLDKQKFRAYFPSVFSADQMDKLDDSGVVRVGQKVKMGDPLVVKMRAVQEDTVSKQLRDISRLLVQDFRDTSETYKKNTPGKVAEVHVRKDDVFVVIKTEEQAKIGDKLVGRYGNKGVITKIVADDEMPQDEAGEPMDLLINPDTVPGRMNLGQLLETTASQIAESDGKKYVAKPFGGDHTNGILKDLKSRGMKDHGTLFDPVDGEKIDGVLHGKQYILKMEHQVEKKMSARGAGPDYSYSLSGQPGSGGGVGGRSVSLNGIYAFLAHGANANLAEMFTFKGTKSMEHWRAIENGLPLPPPNMPDSSRRFVEMLRGMGINLNEDDHGVVKMVPFLDRDVAQVTNGEIQDATALRAKDLKEERGGLFDLDTTGGVIGESWAHVELAEPTPHPTFEKAILSVLHLKKAELEKLMSGELGMIDGELVPGDAPGALTGGVALKEMLKKVDPESRIEEINALTPKKKASQLNKLHREARTLKNFKDLGIGLEEMVVTKLPIMPPKFRPVFELPNGDLHVADVNEHYRAVILVNNQLKQMKDRPGLKSEYNKARASMYEGLRGTMGMSMGLVDKADVKGIAATIAGPQPKRGLFQSKLLKRRQEISGTAVISPDPKLKIDELGVPENMAWKIFEPFVIKELKNVGLTSMTAKKEIKDKTPMAKDALLRAMEDRHVLANRAPTLHKFSFMAFKPKLVPGSAVKVPVEVLGGLNADFDGDTFGIHVPATDDANEEARRLLPSNNIYLPGQTGKKMNVQLTREFMLGLYKLTKPLHTTTLHYKLPMEAIRDAKTRKIRWNDIISVYRIGRTTAGKLLVNEPLPDKFKDYQMVLTDKNIKRILTELEQDDPKAFLHVADEWKHFGRKYAYISGSTFVLSDLQMLTKQRLQLYRQADMQAKRIRSDRSLSEEERDEKLVAIYAKVDSKMMSSIGTMKNNNAGETNNLSDMMNAGFSKPGIHQIKQMVSNVGLMLDHRQKVMPEPVRGNYAEGLSSSEYFQHMFAQRKGMIDKSRSVSGPGALTKQIANTTSRYKVSMRDCGTRQGRMETVDQHIVDRLLATAVGSIQAGTPITTDVLERLKKTKRPQVRVRSPLTCEAQNGVCSMCFGIDEAGHLPYVGKFVGLNQSQAITERTVQLPMKSFHTGGVATADTGTASAFDRALDILNMPQNLKGKATLATVSGAVGSVRKSGFGGKIVVINGIEHKVSAGLGLKVKPGTMVTKGQPISDGVVKPQELLKLRGISAVQTQMRDDLHETFAKSGVRLHKRSFEVPVKMFTDQVRVIDPGDSINHVTGDMSTQARIDSWNKSNPNMSPIKYQNVLPGAAQTPFKTTDWAQRMALGHIKGTLTEGAATGFKSERRGASPFADIALGPGARIPKPGERSF
jgi:DNA-directed RNA polymerase subunit beta'